MKRTAIASSIAILCFGLAGSGLAQGRHDEKPHGMTKQEAPAAAVSVAPREGEQAIALKDGGTLLLRKDGTMYHADAAGKRVRMKDGVVMEAKDGARYMMKNDILWRQITEKGTLHPTHQ